jgi:disulfide bond formation protein DsbB
MSASPISVLRRISIARISEQANIIALFAVCAALVVAFYYQLVFGELPCPLCLLQRVGMIAIGIGFLLNILYGIRSTHYGVGLIGCVLTGLISLRQILLHLAPGDPGYGSTFLGLHFYTLGAIGALLFLFVIAFLLILKSWEQPVKRKLPSMWGNLAIWLFAVLIAGNLLSTVLECGLSQCDDNPTVYQLLKG